MENIAKLKRALIFGIGDNFISQRIWLQENFEIVALADNSGAKQGIVIDGLKVVDLKEAAGSGFDLVIVTPTESESLVGQLIGAGIPREKITLLMELKPGAGADRLRAAFVVSGGYGDRLFALNYIWHFKERYILEGDVLDIFYEGEGKNCATEKYQLVVRITRYPEIIKAHVQSLAKRSPELLDYILQCRKFRLLNERYFEEGFGYAGQASVMAILNGRKRIQQPDLYGLLGMGEDYRYPVPVGSVETDCLARFGVCGSSFITFSKEAEQPVKGWGGERFDEVLEWMAGEYPRLPAVELTGGMDMEDRKILLKNSVLHIDTDSDNVHLRHALHGGVSVVLFGPTSASFYGYSENYNLTGKGCGHFCEGAADGWGAQCLAGGAVPLCMEAVTVEMVGHAVREILGEHK